MDQTTTGEMAHFPDGFPTCAMRAAGYIPAAPLKNDSRHLACMQRQGTDPGALHALGPSRHAVLQDRLRHARLPSA
jgi:hypothetical protein